MKTPSVLSVCSLAFLFTSDHNLLTKHMTLSSNICHEVSCHLRLPRITSSPDNPLIGKRKENVTLSWKFELRPTETWNNSIIEVVFGEWKYPGFLKKKLMLINNTGGKIIRENYEKKISCHFDMSLLQVAFTLHDLDKSDENEYGVQVEFDLSQAPLTDSVKLRLEDPPKINTPQQKNISVRDSESLMIKCHASGFPTPNITWKRLGKTIGNQALYFNSIKKRDSGVYLCEAHNQAGKDSTEITVRVDDSDDLESPTTERVPESPPGTSKVNRPVWIILLLAITGVLIILIMITLIEMMRRSRKRCQKDDIRKIRYKKQIDFTGSNEYFTPSTKLKTVLSSQSL